jgi:E3 ubiquitin-protein ligase UBR2
MLSSQSTRQKELFNKRIGSCAAHAFKCGTSACAFLRVAECQVMYVQLSIASQDDVQVRGSFAAAPYIDQYGETDMGLR